MDIQLHDYQLDCIKKVLNKIEKGEKHLSVAMSTGTGRSFTSVHLAKIIFSERHERVAMVFGYEILMKQAELIAERVGIKEVDFYRACDFISINKTYKCIIFNELRTSDRIAIQRKLLGAKTITISFISLLKEISDKRVDQTTEPVLCVFVTKEAIDIRDVKYADETENAYTIRENLEVVNTLKFDRLQTIKEREEIKEKDNQLKSFIDVYNQAQIQQTISEQAAEIERLRALLQSDEKNKEIKELRIKETEYQKKIAEKNARIVAQDQMISFQQEILAGFGINIKIIQDSFEQIQSIRSTLKIDLESQNYEIKENALKKLQDKVAIIVSDLTDKSLSKNDQEYFRSYLISELTEDVWKKLDDSSKTFLITAKSNYDSMIKMKDSDTFDYSGVCLLVTKALEVEITKRFFLYYKKYLSRKYDSVSQWPYALRKHDRYGVTDEEIDDNDFTLGSIVSVTGLRRDDNSGSIVYVNGSWPARNEFICYAQQELFKFSEKQRIEVEIRLDCSFVDTVRLDYRNPSAHRDRLSKTSAKACLDYVIDVQHMLRNMLSKMKI